MPESIINLSCFQAFYTFYFWGQNFDYVCISQCEARNKVSYRFTRKQRSRE